MIRKQLYLDDDLDHELKLLSGRTGLSEAEHVRRALRRYLEGEHAGSGFAPLVDLASNGARARAPGAGTVSRPGS
ncbi:MAG TPA: CopG family transcriptional regulator [Euzebyales bacterium]|nr:CopG family transcriptional regulator [Euzebyales bacterium]